MGSLSRLFPRSLRVLRHRDLALVQTGNGISQLGTWSQYVALGWGIRELSAWPFAVALSLVAQFLPSLVLGPLGGALADRYPRRTVTIVGNLAAVPPALALAAIVAAGEQTIPLYLALAALGGVALALTQPAMSAVVAEIVPGEELPEAVASTSIIVNLTRILGPSLGALVISGWGLEWAFVVNAVSFFAVVVSWAFVHPPEQQQHEHERWFDRVRTGVRFARRERQISFLLLVTLVISFVVYHAPLLPVITTDLLHSDASGFAVLQAATGAGAMLGALVAGEFITDRRRRVAIGASLVALGSLYVVMGFSSSLALTAAALGCWGFCYFTLSTVVQGLLIAVAPDVFRGRVMGLYSMMAAGGVPIAALIGGGIASVVGPGEALLIASAVLLSFTGWVFVAHQLRLVHFRIGDLEQDTVVRDVPEPAP
jgi:MFS family permease